MKGVIDTGNHILDLVVTHYKSPWSLGKPWFDCLALQRNIDFKDIGVILINDGEESRLPDDLFKDYPFEVRNITIPHAGVSGARNAGIDASDADWVAICDFDDTFLSLNAVHILLTAAADKSKVMYWSPFMEEIPKGEGMIYHTHGENYIFNHGKIYRLSWLRENNIRFCDKLTVHEDVFFNTLAQGVAKNEEIGQIKGSIYLWCWNPGSVSRIHDDWIIKSYNHQIRQRIMLCKEFEDRGLKDCLELTVVKTFIDGYYDFQQESWRAKNLSKDFRIAEQWFCSFMKTYWDVYRQIDPKKIAGMAKIARSYRVEQNMLMMESQTLRDFLLHMNNDVKPITPDQWDLDL